MKHALNVLFIEDSQIDVELERNALEKAHLDVNSRRVDSKEGLAEALRTFLPDLIISDFTLPAMDGMSALRQVRTVNEKTPFIFVSGTIGEERAIEALKEGATDYVVKGNPEALIPRVHRALREVRERQLKERLEESLQQTQRLELIGNLASSIAHDMNNMIAVVSGFSQLALAKLKPESEAARDLQEVLKASERASDLSKHLLTFSRKNRGNPVLLDLNYQVLETTKLLMRVIPERVMIQARVASDELFVRADLNQIEQIIMSLVQNASEAMPKGGIVIVETRKGRDPKLGTFAELRISDSGIGMSQDTLNHLFEPYYTTKKVTSRAGTGLSAAYGIVRSLGGTIDVDSMPELGTTMSLRFPLAEERAVPDPVPQALTALQDGTPTALVVDFSESFRRLGRVVLERQGLRVFEAKDGEEALKVVHALESPLHLLVTDLDPPQIGGRELASQAKVTHPGLRVLFTSGLQKTMEIESSAAVPWFLAKPFSPEEFAAIVHEILREPRS